MRSPVTRKPFLGSRITTRLGKLFLTDDVKQLGNYITNLDAFSWEVERNTHSRKINNIVKDVI